MGTIGERVLITGAMGMLGHHMVEHFIRTTNYEVYIIDKLTYASKGFERLRSSNTLNCPRVHIFTYDLCVPLSEGLVQELGDIRYIIHLCAETHVDHSVSRPVSFVLNNVTSTLHLLEYARTLSNLKRFIYFSTDEVFGPAPPGTAFKEWDPYKPSNPYSASKAASEMICMSYQNTYRLPIIITNTMNIFGERQHVEKFIPKCIRKIRDNETIEIHSDPTCTQPGSRSYIHARDVSDAVLFIIEHGEVGDKYNIAGSREVDNLELALMIGRCMNKEVKYELVSFHADRPYHDTRYALDDSKLRGLGWKPKVGFEAALAKTVEWTLKNQVWLED